MSDKKKKVVIFSGAGLDRESGVLTFRDCEDGLWNNYKVEDVATLNGWKANRQLVLDFYNERRREMPNVHPNDAHKALVKLEEDFEVIHVTQNVSDLLERAGATTIYHLHGELTKARPEFPQLQILAKCEPVDIGYKDINIGDTEEDGNIQLRPHIVWFGEYPFSVNEAYEAIESADILLIIGTSLNITYTLDLLAAANTINGDNPCKAYFIDPEPSKALDYRDMVIEYVNKTAVEGVTEIVDKLIAENKSKDENN